MTEIATARKLCGAMHVHMLMFMQECGIVLEGSQAKRYDVFFVGEGLMKKNNVFGICMPNAVLF